MTTHAVIAGVDGGPASVAVLEAALREAALRRSGVRALICWPNDDRHDEGALMSCQTFQEATALIEAAIVEVTRRHPQHAPVVREVCQSFAGPTLVAAARDAELLVIGSTTRGWRGRHHGRQTLEHCLRYAQTPVLVVPLSEPAGADAPTEAASDSRTG